MSHQQKKVPSSLADLGVSGDVLVNKGNIDCSANPNYPAATAGDTYIVSVAGKIGGASGTDVDIKDMIVCKTTAIAGTQAAVGSSWFVLDGDDDLTLQILGTLINSATAKSTPVDADMVGLMDSAAGNTTKKLSWLNIKATLKTYFDTLYAAAGSYLTASSTDTLTNKTIDADGTGNSITNLRVADLAAGVIDIDLSSVSGSDDTIPSAKATKSALDAKEATANKDATGGYAGLTLFKLNLKNAANTFTNFLTNATTAARTWTMPDKDGTVAMLDDISGGTTIVTCIPTPVAPLNLKSADTYDFVTAQSMATNTVQYIAQIIIPFDITVNKFTIGHTSTPTDGTFDVSLYSADGQTRLFTKETATLTGNGTAVTTTLDAPVDVTAGVYYIGVNSNGAASVSMLFWSTGTIDGDGTGIKPFFVVSGEQTIMGRLTITAGTPAASFNPASDIIYEPLSTLYVRFDN